MSGALENALVLLARARDDCYAVSRLADDERTSLWIIGFHAQQTVEKAIKSVLSAHSVKYPFTHDLELLIKILFSEGIAVPPEADQLPLLSPFATLFRYGDDGSDEGDGTSLIERD